MLCAREDDTLQHLLATYPPSSRVSLNPHLGFRLQNFGYRVGSFSGFKGSEFRALFRDSDHTALRDILSAGR